MTPAEELAEALLLEGVRLRRLKRQAALIAGTRARQAEGALDGAVTAIEQARAFLLAASSGFFPAAPTDPRREPDE